MKRLMMLLALGMFLVLPIATYATEITVEEEVALRRPIVRTIRGATIAVVPELFKVSVLTKQGEVITFYRYGMSPASLKARIQANAATNGVLRIWGEKNAIRIQDIQNISVEKVYPKRVSLDTTNGTIVPFYVS